MSACSFGIDLANGELNLTMTKSFLLSRLIIKVLISTAPPFQKTRLGMCLLWKLDTGLRPNGDWSRENCPDFHL